MPDRSPEDEIMSEARQFMAAMSATLRRYSQAATWLERRKIRREINQAWRLELKAEEAARAQSLRWANQSVDHYRAHSLAVAERADNPTVDHQRRYRDAQALSRHRADMHTQILRNPRLTVIEQGIALDGLDAATTFPGFEPGRLFDRTNKVKGREALHYRAQVARARETAGLERPPVQPMRHIDPAAAGRDTPTRDTFGPSLQGHAAKTWRRAHAAEMAREDLATPGAWIAEEDLRPGYEEEDLTRAYESSLFAWQQAERALAPLRIREDQASTGVTEQEPHNAGKDRRRTESSLPERDTEVVPQGATGTAPSSPARTAQAEPPRFTTIDQAVDGLSELIRRNPATAEHVMREVPELAGMVAARMSAAGQSGHDGSRNPVGVSSAPTRAEYDALARQVNDLSTKYHQADAERRTALDDLSGLRADHAKLTAQLTQLTTERDNAVFLATERTRERDEATAKVITLTPPEQRISTHKAGPNVPQRPKVSMTRPEMAGAPGNGALRPDIGDGFDR